MPLEKKNKKKTEMCLRAKVKKGELLPFIKTETDVNFHHSAL